jgi:two-component system response regulator NreC
VIPPDPGQPAARTSIRILLVADHCIVRECLCAVLAQQRGMTVAALAQSGKEAIAVATRLKPDLVLMDLALAGLSATDAAHRILAALPAAKILMLSSSVGADQVGDSTGTGAHGYVAKGAACTDLMCAIWTVMAGDRYISPHLAHASGGDETHAALWQRMSVREREVLRRTAAGLSTAHIALQLSLSPKTVNSYRSRLMRKLGLPNRSMLIRYALRHALSPA